MPRIANRPIVCHVLEALREAGTRELALAVPPEALEEVRQSVMEECDLDVDITYLTTDGRRDLRSTLAAIEPFVGEDPCLIRTADGVGQRLSPVDELIADGAPDLVSVPAPRLRLQPSAQRSRGAASRHHRARQLEERARAGRRCATSAPAPCAGPPRVLPANVPVDLVTVAERLAEMGGRVDVRQLRPVALLPRRSARPARDEPDRARSADERLRRLRGQRQPDRGPGVIDPDRRRLRERDPRPRGHRTGRPDRQRLHRPLHLGRAQRPGRGRRGRALDRRRRGHASCT